MYNGKKILAVVTARAGSKRLPNKNSIDLCGKPLIAWTIEEANKSKYIDKVLVSTDSEKLANIAKDYNASVPFLRPEHLATDTAKSIDVILHSINFFKNEYDIVVLLQPTSPLRKVSDIDGAIETINNEIKSVVSVSEVEHSPLWSNTLPEDLSMANFFKEEIKNKRSQDLPSYYRLNGAVYVSDIAYLKLNLGFFGGSTKAFIMSSERSIDIDTEIDLLLAEVLIKNNKI